MEEPLSTRILIEIRDAMPRRVDVLKEKVERLELAIGTSDKG